MATYRVTEDSPVWQKAGVHFVRASASLKPLGATLEGEFGEDTPSSEYILVTADDDFPASTCRLHILSEDTAKIERVATTPACQHKHFGSAAVKAAEKWLKERGIKRVVINARTAVVHFYETLGYKPDYTKITGSGTFECVLTEKDLAAQN